VVAGTKKLFLESGMNDFIAKPIEFSELNKVLSKWLPENKKKTGVTNEDYNSNETSFLADWKEDCLNLGAAKQRYCGEDEYLNVLRVYAKHTPALLDAIRNPIPERLNDYAITVHGIKGSSYSICADEVGHIAEGLEAAAKRGNFGYVAERNGVFIESVETLINKFCKLLDKRAAHSEKPIAAAPSEENLRLLLESCEHYDAAAMEHAMERLESCEYDAKSDMIIWLREQIDMLEYDGVINRLKLELSKH
jgi:HPt (histidine-containing phosphotransfer) domain-containing protein